MKDLENMDGNERKEVFRGTIAGVQRSAGKFITPNDLLTHV